MTLHADPPRDHDSASPALLPARPAGLETVRLVALGYLVAAFGGIIRYRLTTPDPAGLLAETVEYATDGVAIAIMLFRPVLGALVGVVAVALPLMEGPSDGDVPTMMVAAIMVVASAPARRWVVLIPYAIYTASVIATRPPFDGILHTLGLAAGVAIGLGVRAALAASEQRRAWVADLRRSTLDARASERRLLASELEEIAGRSLASIRSDASTSAADPGPLNAALVRIGDTARSALVELKRLVTALRADQPPDPRSTLGTEGLPAAPVARLVASAFSIGIAVSTGATAPTVTPEVVVGVADCLVAVLLLWAPRTGAALTAVALAAAVAGYTTPQGLLLLLLFSAALAALRTDFRRLGALILAGQLVFCGAWTALTSDGSVGDGLGALTAVALGWLGGLSVRHFTDARRRELASVEAAAAARAAARRLERDELSRELHDVVAHQLSLVSLQVLGHEGSDDVEELLSALGRCRGYAQEASAELRLLVTAMTEPEDAASATSPSAAAESLAAALREDGHAVTLAVDPTLDVLEGGVRLAVVRILQEAGTNVLRYSRPGSACTITLRTSADHVLVTVSSPLPDAPLRSDLSSGWGLRGLGERAALLGGNLCAGPEGDTWVVSAELPRRAGAGAQSAPPT